MTETSGPEEQRHTREDHTTALTLRAPVAEQLFRVKNGDLFNSHEILALWAELKTQPVGAIDLEVAQIVQKLALGNALTATPRFGLRLINGELRYYHVRDHLSQAELNPLNTEGRLFHEQLFSEEIARVSHPKLMSPHGGLADTLSAHVLDHLILLEKELQRVTRYDSPYGPLITTTHTIVDGDAWAPNIDTVFGVKWLMEQLGKKKNPITVTAEVGCGSGLHSVATLLARNAIGAKKGWVRDPESTVHVITDISPGAINAARRNTTPYLAGARLEWFLGKGVGRLREFGPIDFGVCNPPYLPHHEGRDSVDRYSGTGLIGELFEYLPVLLNPDNPEAAFYVQPSNLSMQDIAAYARMYPHVVVTQVSAEEEVPLRVYSVKNEPAWSEHLKQFGLIDYSEAAEMPLAQPHWHRIMMLELKVKR